MATGKGSDPFKRNKTRYRGVTYRVRADGSKTYSVYFQGSHLAVEGGEREALARQAELRGKAARGETPIVPAMVTFAVVAEQWIESKRHLRPYTRRNYRAYLDRILLPKFGKMKVAAITPEHVAGLLRDLEKRGLSAATITDYTKPLSGTLAFALRRGLIATNPCSVLTRDDRPQPKPKQPVHVWSDDEMDALIEASERLAKLPQARYDYSPVLRLALFTGLRLGELLGLQWKDIDLHEGELHVRRQWTRLGEYALTKSNAGVRRVPLSADVVTFLTALKLTSPFSGDDDPVFASMSGKPLGHRNVTRRGSEPAIKEAGIEGVSIHDLRHAFASRMISRGVELVTLASLMGHEDARITLSRYAHVYDNRRTDEAVRQAMAR